jgi:trigger factor
MKIQVEAVSPIEKKLTIEIDPARVAKEIDRAYVGLGRRARIPGFRPGKVPRNVLVRNFRAEVEREAVEKLIQDAWTQAVHDEAIDAVASPDVSLADGTFDAEKPLKFTAQVQVRPKVTPRDYKGLQVVQKPVQVTEATVDAELDGLRQSYSSLQEVTGREVAEEGDYATIDHEGTVDGQPFRGSTAQGVTVRVQAGLIDEGNFHHLKGAKIGDTVEFDSAFAADHRLTELQGKSAHFKATLKGLKVRQAPPFDDAFARSVGIEGVETLAQLRTRMTADIERREKARSESELRDALVKAALEKNDFEVPPALVERAIDAMIQSTAERFARQGIDMRHLQLDLAKLRGDLRERALQQVRGALLLDAIAEAEKVEATDDDVEKELARVAGELGVPLEKARRDFRGKDARVALSTRIREEKALAILTSSATIKPQ